MSILQKLSQTKVLISLLLIVAIVGAGIYFQRKSQSANNERYKTAQVDRGIITQKITANGTLNPVTVVNVGTQVSGTVVKLYTDYNQPVKAGQVLLELDPALIKGSIAQIEANMHSSEATLRLNESTFKRNQELVTKGFISPATLEQNQKEVDVAKAQLAQVTSQLNREKINLEYTIIRSPINGIVIDRKIDIGQTVAASFSTPTLFQIAKDLDHMQIDTSVAEADVGRLKEGMLIRFTVDAYPDRDFPGKIRMVRLNPSIQQNVVTYNVIVDVTNENNSLKPGMTAQVSMVIAEKPDAIRIPNAALRFKPQADDKKKDATDALAVAPKASPIATLGTSIIRKPPSRVYKKDGKGELQVIEFIPGIASNQFTEVLSGEIKAGDELVIRDMQDKNAKK